MRYRTLALLLVVAACTRSTEPGSQTIPGRWTTATKDYSQLRLTLTERDSDHLLFGYWAGVCRSGGCLDSGIVYYGARQGSELTFGLTALNSSTRSISVSGQLGADSSIAATLQVSTSKVKSDPEEVTFRFGR